MSSEFIGITVGLSEAQLAFVSRSFLKSGVEPVAITDSLALFPGADDLARCGCVVAPLPRSAADVRRFVHSFADRQSPLKVVFLTEQADVTAVVAAVRSGASDVLSFPASEAAFQTAVEVACRESAEQQARLAAKVAAQEKLARLSDGERDVLELMLAGKVNKSVASRLGIALRTVENRRKQIFTKLGTRSLAEIVHFVRLVQGAGVDDAFLRIAATAEPPSQGWDRAAAG